MAGKNILRNTANGEKVYNKEYVDYLESLVVKLSGNQTISGVKTFGSSPIVPVPTEPTQVANKAYADSILGRFAVPDYAKIVQLFSKNDLIQSMNNNGNYYRFTWTADKNGFVRCSLNYNNNLTTSVAYVGHQVYVNGQLASRFQTYETNGSYPVNYSPLSAVKVGDIVQFDFISLDAQPKTVSAHFIPVAPSSNFNVYNDWDTNTRVTLGSSLNIPAASWVDVFTATETGHFVAWFGGTLTKNRIIFSINDPANYIGDINHDATYIDMIAFDMKAGDHLFIRPDYAPLVNNSLYANFYKKHVSVANAASAWVNVPLTRVSGFTSGTIELFYNASLGLYELHYDAFTVPANTSHATQVASVTTPGNLPVFLPNSFVEGGATSNNNMKLYGVRNSRTISLFGTMPTQQNIYGRAYARA